MKAEYLILNFIILIGPMLLSFDRKVRYVVYWSKVFISLGIVMIPFLLWDMAVTGIHWHFNDRFTLDFRLFGLPLGEWLFFISVPFASLFIWQIIVTHQRIKWMNNKNLLVVIAVIGCSACCLFMLWNKIYTSLVCLFVVFTIFFDQIIKTHLFSQKRTYLFLFILTGLIFIFNGYLTARPVVLYDSKYLTDVRIWTIPIEDFGYGYALILLCTILFEKIKDHLDG